MLGWVPCSLAKITEKRAVFEHMRLFCMRPFYKASDVDNKKTTQHDSGVIFNGEKR